MSWYHFSPQVKMAKQAEWCISVKLWVTVMYGFVSMKVCPMQCAETFIFESYFKVMLARTRMKPMLIYHRKSTHKNQKCSESCTVKKTSKMSKKQKALVPLCFFLLYSCIVLLHFYKYMFSLSNNSFFLSFHYVMAW